MIPNSSPISFSFVVLALLPAVSSAVTMTNNDGFGTSSFDTAGNWDSLAAPAIGNDYFTGNFVMRTPAAAGDFEFAGDSLTVDNNSAYPNGLLYKGVGSESTVTIDNLILNQGLVSTANGPADFLNLYGAINVVADSFLYPKQSAINIFSEISGTSRLTIQASDTISGPLSATNKVHIHSASNTYTGNIVNNGRFETAPGSNLNFVIGVSGFNNGISNGTAGTQQHSIFGGDFDFDLTNASASLGDSWQIINTVGASTFYLDTFSVSGWTEVYPGGHWWDPTNTYRFTESNGVLTVAPHWDSDSDGLADLWEDRFFGNNDGDPIPSELARQNGSGDGYPVADGDNLNNLGEQGAGTDPNNADSDNDGLHDGPEVNGTNNALVSHGFGPSNPLDADSDTDGISDGDEISGVLNTANGNAATNPNSADTDGDGMGDAYELANNTPGTALDPNDNGGNVASQAPTEDRDGDGLSNLAEFDPSQGSNSASPQTRADMADTDSDGLSDRVEDNIGSWGGFDFTGTNPTLADTDNDGLADSDENFDLTSYQGSGTTPAWSDPNEIDTDGDGFGDGYEVNVSNTDPNNSGDAPTQPSGFNLVEDFEGSGMNIGQSFNNVNGWSTLDANWALVADEPIAGGDQVGSFLPTIGSPSLSALDNSSALTAKGLPILDGNTGTLFFQVYTTAAGIDNSFGLSDDNAPNTFANYEVQFAMIGNGTMGLRTNTGFISYPGGGYRVEQWMNVWLVANNDTDTVDVYVESPDGESGQVLISNDLPFRNGTTEALRSFLMLENLGTNRQVLIDNIYVDPTAENLTTPAAAKPVATGYASWSAANAGGQSPELDFDNDGMENGVEYFMNTSAGFTSNPTVNDGAVTWPNGGNIPSSDYGTQFVIQTSPDLENWTDVLVGDLTANSDGPDGSLEYTLPTGRDKIFVRLEVSPN